MPDITQYKVGVVVSLESCPSSNSIKKLRACQVNVASESSNETITVVTAASNVREGSRYDNIRLLIILQAYN